MGKVLIGLVAIVVILGVIMLVVKSRPARSVVRPEGDRVVKLKFGDLDGEEDGEA